MFNLLNSIRYSVWKFVLFSNIVLRFDDLIDEENEIAQVALRRLDEKESYDRVFRLLQASQLSLSAKILSKDQAMTAENDRAYLIPYLLEAEKAAFERVALDNISVVKK